MCCSTDITPVDQRLAHIFSQHLKLQQTVQKLHKANVFDTPDFQLA